MPMLLTFSDGLTISAIVLALTAIAFEVVFFILQTQQLYRGQKESSGYIGEMKQVLGKIEGLTTGTRDQLQTQFDRVLDAALSQRVPTLLSEARADSREEGRAEASVFMQIWLVGRTVRKANWAPEVKRTLMYLAADDTEKTLHEITEHLRSGYEEEEKKDILKGSFDMIWAVASLVALEATEWRGEGLALTQTGRQAVKALAAP